MGSEPLFTVGVMEGMHLTPRVHRYWPPCSWTAAASSLPPYPLPHHFLVTFQKSRVGDMTAQVVHLGRCSYLKEHERPPHAPKEAIPH